jgi:hypothetical protein
MATSAFALSAAARRFGKFAHSGEFRVIDVVRGAVPACRDTLVVQMKTDPQKLFQRGVELFNHGEFFECHEALEELWTPTRPPERWFLQSLIHFAVGLYHHERGNRLGASRQMKKGLSKICGYLPEWGGVRTARLEREMRGCLEINDAGGVIQAFPKIEQFAAFEPRNGGMRVARGAR